MVCVSHPLTVLLKGARLKYLLRSLLVFNQFPGFAWICTLDLELLMLSFANVTASTTIQSVLLLDQCCQVPLKIYESNIKCFCILWILDIGLPPEGHVNQPVLVATCHVHWDPEFCDVKLIQTMMLMHKLQAIIKDSVKILRPDTPNPDCNGIPLILCGDLNSLPDSGTVFIIIINFKYTVNGLLLSVYNSCILRHGIFLAFFIRSQYSLMVLML